MLLLRELKRFDVQKPLGCMFMIRYALSAYSTSCNFFSLSQGLVRAQLAFKEKKLLKTCYICLTGFLRGIFGGFGVTEEPAI